ncbi:hypothetical protein Mapa_010676 [Marchantia paleacea]|nr:hypothetical protein Mapa_010676 [Marchantia paleacea]
MDYPIPSPPSSVQSYGRRRVIRKVPKVLGKVLVKGVSKLARHFSGDQEALEKGAMVMAAVAEAQKDGAILESFPPILATVVEPLFEDENQRMQEQCAKAIAIVAAQVAPELCEMMLEFPRTLEGLVGLFFRTERYHVQEGAAFALMNIAGGGGSECQRMIALYPRALEGIVGLLSQERSALVLLYGASMIYLLGIHPDNQKMIMEFPGALEGVVRVLLKTEVPVAQARAALALSALALGSDMKNTIADFPEALRGILHLLTLDEFPDVQECAVTALASIITAESTPRILEFPNLPTRLQLLAKSYEVAIVAIVDLDYYNKKESAKQNAEHSLVQSRRVPELRLLNFPTSN